MNSILALERRRSLSNSSSNSKSSKKLKESNDILEQLISTIAVTTILVINAYNYLIVIDIYFTILFNRLIEYL